jgi:hypothetical protein
MTDVEVWEHLQKCIAEGAVWADGIYRYKVHPEAPAETGICSGLWDMYIYMNAIASTDIERLRNMLDKMLKRIRPDYRRNTFVWPLDEHGARGRMKFCELLAEECRKAAAQEQDEPAYY